MKRPLLIATACALAAGCGLPLDVGSTEEALSRCDGGECKDAGAPDSGHACGPGLPACPGGDVCVNGVCRPRTDSGIEDAGEPDAGREDGGEPDGGEVDAGHHGCDAGQGDAGSTCAQCGPGLPACPHGDVCFDGVCIHEGADGGEADAGHGCGGGQGDAGNTCGECGPGLPACPVGDVCDLGWCVHEGDGGQADAGAH